ncbi:MAG: exopolyphosphatase [Proteobacteria bacterium]|nr:exopolyphosphatase [Pseudomonadota bacterium]
MSNASPATIAAIDLGSNSFHMIVAHTVGDHFRIVDRIRSAVRLGAGLGADNQLDPAAIERAMTCLAQFGERLRGLPSEAVRVVGTNTLRKARNTAGFLARAEALLGHRIDVITGTEEARLIYLGVSHGLDDDADVRLVVDIGGGSSEFILGRRFDPLYMESLHMGCVGHSQQYFGDGHISASRFKAAELAARQELETIETSYRRIGWQSVIGASGTIMSVGDVLRQQGGGQDGITSAELERLKQQVLAAGHVDKLNMPGLPDERRAVFAGGVAILCAIFDALGISRMRVSDSAIREGLLYDLLGRIHQEDVRERAVGELAARYHIDRAQALRVESTAIELLRQVAQPWGVAGEDNERLLRWASALHEIGLSVTHSQYHKHGAYLLTYLDMPGFATGEQQRLAALVRGHRRKVPLADWQRLPAAQQQRVLRLGVLLRIARLVHRRRSEEALSQVEASVENGTLKLRFAHGWLDAHALTRADLEQEALYLKAANIKLKFK